MKIDVQLTPNPPNPKSLHEKIVIVIDILRATSVIVYAFSQGVKEIIPVKTVKEAFEKLKIFPEGSTILGGERKNRKIKGFDLGNSPQEYTRQRIGGKRLILTTTNGTKAFSSVSSGRDIYVGSFFNINALAERCLENDLDILIFPAGDEGKFSLEDTVCAGMLIDLLIKRVKEKVFLTDSSYASLFVYQRFDDNLIGALHLAQHGKELIEGGVGDDLVFCAQVNITSVVPIFRNGVISL
jgi:2-phosphosulfolactate phosphatase